VIGRPFAEHKQHSYHSYMKVVNLADVKNDLSRYVAEVRRGGRVRILIRGVPAADLVPVSESSDAELQQIEALGLIRRGVPLGAADERELGRAGPRVKGGRAVEALVEERRSGR
jgi:prevent-host-death family protein